MTAPLLIAQISELHIKRPGERAYEMVDTAAALERCIAHLNAFRPRPAFVVISGDLVDRGLEEEYAHLRQFQGTTTSAGNSAAHFRISRLPSCPGRPMSASR